MFAWARKTKIPDFFYFSLTNNKGPTQIILQTLQHKLHLTEQIYPSSEKKLNFKAQNYKWDRFHPDKLC